MLPVLRNQIATYVKRVGSGGRTLEIGSYDVNGAVADLFDNHIGTDMQPGPGVDWVRNSHHLLDDFAPEQFDTIVWLETMEHDDAFWVTMRNINQLIVPGGHVMMSAPAIGFPRHDYPSDYWRFTEDAFRVLLRGWDILDLRTLKAGPVCALAHLPERSYDVENA